MEDQLNQRISRAKELLQTVRHAAMATVNEDGSPHNTPFFFLYNPKLTKIYWGSHPDSLHSKNVTRTGKIFVVLYDAHEKGGLYIAAAKGHSLAGKELDEALNIHNSFRACADKQPIKKDYYQGSNPQRMYSADITNFWVHLGKRTSSGLLIKEVRHEITADDLLSQTKL